MPKQNIAKAREARRVRRIEKEALGRILDICTRNTHQTAVDDLAEIAAIAQEADLGRPLPASWTKHTPA